MQLETKSPRWTWFMPASYSHWARAFSVSKSLTPCLCQPTTAQPERKSKKKRLRIARNLLIVTFILLPPLVQIPFPFETVFFALVVRLIDLFVVVQIADGASVVAIARAVIVVEKDIYV